MQSMLTSAIKALGILALLMLPYKVYGQEVQTRPEYEDGDWWKVKVSVDYNWGRVRSGDCTAKYPEYLVKIEDGTPSLYGIRGTKQEEFDCPPIRAWVLGTGKRLKFPLRLGRSWKTKIRNRRTGKQYKAKFEVLAFERIKTPKGTFEAFKVTMEPTDADWVNTYYYSPEVKAVVLRYTEGGRIDRTNTVVDYGLVSAPQHLKGPELKTVSPPSLAPTPRETAVASVPVATRSLHPTPRREGKRFAVLIGIGDYQNPAITDLAYATADAKSIYDLLTDPGRGGFAKENVKLILGCEATRRKIVDAIGDWLFRRAGPEDEVFIYYAGHGAVEKDRTGIEPDGLSKYLVPADADPHKLFVTGIANTELARLIQALNTKRLVFFLDSCYSAGTTGLGRALTTTGFRAGSLSGDLYGQLAGTGQAVVAAAKPNQVALELSSMGHGLFTKFILDGLSGAADVNGDGQVSLLELYPYLSREVARVARQEGGIQEPVFRGSISGDLVLASVPETLHKLSQETRIELLSKHYAEGAISAKQLDKGVQILESGKRDRLLEDFLQGKLSLSTFHRLF